jgi:uncharacterized membrane protein YcjF (UPF0283 family)
MSESPEYLGRPVQKLRPETPSPQAETTEIPINHSPGSGRAGDNTLGRPVQKPREFQESNLSRTEIERENQAEITTTEIEEIFTQPITMPLAWLSGIWLGILLFAGIIGWFVFAQILSTIQIITQLPLLVQPIAWGLVIFFSFIIIYPLSRLLLVYRRLKPVRQIQMTRISIKNMTVQQLQVAKQNLSEYLHAYPLDDNKFIVQLKAMGLSETEQKKLRRTQQELLENSPKTTAVWLQEFEQDFLNPLDEIVKARIQYYAKLLAVKTALSPNALLDMAVVLYNGFSLLRDICVLYQVRIGHLGMMYLLGLIIFQSYVAGQIENHAEGMENWMENVLSDGVLGTTGAKLASLTTSKVGEAAVHYFFLRRIGRSMMSRLRPLNL